MRLIAGLGNPGSEYDGTRHNIGFEVVDKLADKYGVELKKGKFGAAFGQTALEDKKLILLKPLKYMNNSGQVIATAAGFYKLQPLQILVITDDLALEPGTIRMRASGSAGGHNGLVDIIEKLGTSDFPRLRIGIGDKGPAVGKDYVLSRPGSADRELLREAVQQAVEASICWMQQGVDAAMTKFNRKKI
ncbi:MAG: aminoacyl-tRNA hydrolase [Planctomycetes bacterium GWF2_41_51]|nr:MAG: aminoacyl-tRNA hydrolase [Planctomycetes bacterium GWF2_41_51]HBG27375.1 aminoacyl-tRNA hydrolase [Phycisphaerales bacterium]